MNDIIETMTVNEVARMFNLSPRTIYRRVKENEIPYFRVGSDSRAIRFVKAKMLQVMEPASSNA